MSLTLGQHAPSFTARNQHGELAALRDDHESFVTLGSKVLAVSCDAIYSLRAYADTEGVPFDLLSDHWPHGAIAQAYGVFDELAGCARRGTFVLDSAGLIRCQQINQINEPREITAVLAATANL